MMNFGTDNVQLDSDFQKILDNTYEQQYGSSSKAGVPSSSSSNVSHGDIDKLIDKYATQNNIKKRKIFTVCC